jgi:predicted ATPase
MNFPLRYHHRRRNVCQFKGAEDVVSEPGAVGSFCGKRGIVSIDFENIKMLTWDTCWGGLIMPVKLPLIDSIKLKNFLSFGPESMELELKPLNILIGPNGSGKSNLIEAIGLLRSASKDLTAPIRDGGGISEWLWKGDPQTPISEIDATVNYPSALISIRHHIAFTREGQRFKLEDESIENSRPDSASYKNVQFYYRFRKGRPVMNVCESGDFIERTLQLDDVAFDQSVLSQ